MSASGPGEVSASGPRGESASGPRGESASGRGGWCLPLVPGGCVSQHAMGQTPPPQWTEFLTHASENITLPQLRSGR